MIRARENSVPLSLRLGSRAGRKPAGAVARAGWAGSAPVDGWAGGIVRRHRSPIVVALLVIAAATGRAGYLLVRKVSPPYRQADLEKRLLAALATPVTIEKITASPENWIQLEAREVRAWSGGDGFGLKIPRVVDPIDPLSLRVGERRLRRLHVEGVVLRVGAIGGPAADARFTRNGTTLLPGVRLFVKRGFQALGSLLRPELSKSQQDPPTAEFARPEKAVSRSKTDPELSRGAADQPVLRSPAAMPLIVTWTARSISSRSAALSQRRFRASSSTWRYESASR